MAEGGSDTIGFDTIFLLLLLGLLILLLFVATPESNRCLQFVHARCRDEMDICNVCGGQGLTWRACGVEMLSLWCGHGVEVFQNMQLGLRIGISGRGFVTCLRHYFLYIQLLTVLLGRLHTVIHVYTPVQMSQIVMAPLSCPLQQVLIYHAILPSGTP
jgi:hypothetical protein